MLGFHDLDRFLRAEERTREVDCNDGAPLLVSEIFHQNAGPECTGVVEQNIQPSESFFDPGEERSNRFRFADIRGHGKHLPARTIHKLCGFFEFRTATPGQHHGISGGV